MTTLPAVASADPLVSPPDLGVAAVSTTTRTRTENQRGLGLDMLWLPLESRTSLVDLAGKNLPGALLDEDGGLRLRGGRPGDTVFELDGFRLRRPLVPPGLIDRLAVTTAGHAAPWADAIGGVVGLSTMTPDNNLRTSAEAFYESRHRERGGFGASVSGPLVRDRLWIAAALQGTQAMDPQKLDPDQLIQPQAGFKERAFQGAVKLTWAPRAGHRVESTTLLNLNGSENEAPFTTLPEAQPVRHGRGIFTGLRWIGQFGGRLSARSQIAFHADRDRQLSRLCDDDPVACNATQGTIGRGVSGPIIRGNGSRHETERDTGWQMFNAVKLDLHRSGTLLLGVRATSRLATRWSRWDFAVPAGGYRDFIAERQVSALGQTRAGATTFRSVQSVEVEGRVFDRLWMVPGVAVTSAAFDTEAASVSDHVLTPHMGVAWDATGDGRTWLRAAIHRRAAGDLDGLVGAMRPTPELLSCPFDPITNTISGECSRLRDGTTLGMPCGATGLTRDGAPCRQDFALPVAWEQSMGIERSFADLVAVGIDLVHRRASGMEARRETNQRWDAAGRSLLGFEDGRRQLTWDYSGQAGAYRRYLGVTTTIRSQPGPFGVSLAYTYARLRENWVDISGDPSALIIDPSEHPAPDERTHSVRAMASLVLGYLGVAMVYTLDSGLPVVNRLRRPPDAYEDYRRRFGINPGTALTDPTDDRPTHGPGTSRLDLQLRLRASQFTGIDVDLFFDVINAFDEKNVQLLNPGSPFPSFAIGEGRWWRVGLQHRY